jgi:hypothetical protein
MNDMLAADMGGEEMKKLFSETKKSVMSLKTMATYAVAKNNIDTSEKVYDRNITYK